MAEPITKNQLAWLVLRVAGAYLITTSIYGLLIIIWQWAIVHDFGVDLSDIPGMKGISIFQTLLVLCKAGLGFYFLLRGVWLHELIMQQNEYQAAIQRQPAIQKAPTPNRKTIPKPEEPRDPATQLTQKETKQFEEWLLQNPQYKNRSGIDQIALFRDHLKSSE